MLSIKKQAKKQVTCFLRTKQQLISDNNINMTIYAPEWVTKMLPEISNWLDGYEVVLEGTPIPPGGQKFIVSKDQPITLQQLQMLARNENRNTDGIIKFKQFPGLTKEQVFSIKDLVRHCVVVGKDKAIRYRGYPSNTPQNNISFDEQTENIICDLAALQFQESYNSGRLVLVPKDGSSLPQGSFDGEIFQQTVGRAPQTASIIAGLSPEEQQQFPTGTFKGKKVYLDLDAYRKFVAQDFILATIGVSKQAKLYGMNNIWFNFLNYGTGFFADSLDLRLQEQLKISIYQGILDGLKTVLTDPILQIELDRIKCFSFPFFYQPTNKPAQSNVIRRIKAEITSLCKEHGKTESFEDIDALQPRPNFTVATTNCGDPHAMLGDEMFYGSVDAAIAENLQNKGNAFSALLNEDMKSELVAITLTKAKLSELDTLSKEFSLLRNFKFDTNQLNECLNKLSKNFPSVDYIKENSLPNEKLRDNPVLKENLLFIGKVQYTPPPTASPSETETTVANVFNHGNEIELKFPPKPDGSLHRVQKDWVINFLNNLPLEAGVELTAIANGFKPKDLMQILKKIDGINKTSDSKILLKFDCTDTLKDYDLVKQNIEIHNRNIEKIKTSKVDSSFLQLEKLIQLHHEERQVHVPPPTATQHLANT